MASSRPEKEACFVVSPIGEPDSPIRRRADQFIKFLVEPAIGDLYTIVRADQIATPGSINRQVFEHLLKDGLVVADLTGHNPNVFYELAVRHAFAKPYVQMIHAADKIPFDLFDQRTLKFDLSDLESVEAAKIALRELAEATRVRGFRVVTPIGEAAGISAALADASADVRDVIEVVEGRFKSLDDKIVELSAEVATLRGWLAHEAREVERALMLGPGSDVTEDVTQHPKPPRARKKRRGGTLVTPAEKV